MSCFLDELLLKKDENYAAFSARIIPSVTKEHIIGVRVPNIRMLSKRVFADPLKSEFYSDLPHFYLEENMLHVFLLAKEKNIAYVFDLLEAFLPCVDNWATCDSLPPKIFSKHPDLVQKKVVCWLQSSHTYTVRFAIVTLIQYFLDSSFRPVFLSWVKDVKSNDYYVKMAQAWFFSFALIKQYETTLPHFVSPCLDKWVHNKSIQKAQESFRISLEQKSLLKTLKL